MRIHLKKRYQKKIVSEFRSESLAASRLHPHFVNVSASSECSGESVHCAASTEPSSFVNLIVISKFHAMTH